jgi:ABC-type sulfate/molybdate transport systems ATPase subunit
LRLEMIDSGEIRFGERRVGHLPPGARGVAMAFQHYALYPRQGAPDEVAPRAHPRAGFEDGMIRAVLTPLSRNAFVTRPQ